MYGLSIASCWKKSYAQSVDSYGNEAIIEREFMGGSLPTRHALKEPTLDVQQAPAAFTAFRNAWTLHENPVACCC